MPSQTREVTLKAAASLLDRRLRVSVVDFRLKLRVDAATLSGLDALQAVAGRERSCVEYGGQWRWRCQDQEDVRDLLEAVVPYMEAKSDLAEACLDFLDADTEEALLRLAFKVSRLS